MKVKERFTFVNTSGGQSTPGQIYFSNKGPTLPTWKWVFTKFGTPTIADAGYGVGGAADPSGYAAWMVLANLTARIPEGCIAVCQNSAPSTYANDIIAIRSKLPTPPKCPAGNVAVAPLEHTEHTLLNVLPANGTLEIINVSGRIVSSQKISQGNFSWDAWKSAGAQLRPGAYFLRLNGNTAIAQKRIVVN
jgi:hypothetical protein